MRTVRIASAVAASALLVGGLTACSSGKTGGQDAAQAGAKPGAASGAAGGSASGAASAPASGAAGGSAAGVPGEGLAPKAALLASAAVMEKAGSAKLGLSGAGANANGTGAYSWKAPAAFELTMNTADGPGKMLVTADVMYIGVDAETGAEFGGKHWLKLDPKAAAAANGKAVPGGEDAGSMTTLLQTLNPAVQLAANAQGGKLSKVGAEKIGGADTVHYQSALPVEALVGAMAGLSDDLKKQVVATLKKQSGSVTTDFWINAKGELVQQKSDNVGNGSKEPVTITYSDLGSAGAVQAPAASDVLDFAELLKGGGLNG